MDPSELRMNLAALQRIDPYIRTIVTSSPQVALYKYLNTEWDKTNIEGTLFVYERTCEPFYGFLILNRLSATNLIQPIAKEIELQDKTPFMLYKTKDNTIHGIWFYEESNCKKVFTTINQFVDMAIHPVPKQQQTSYAKASANANNGNSLADLLSNAGNKGKAKAKPSPSGGEKLLRLLSSQGDTGAPDSERKADGGSVAAFFAQASQGNATVGPPPGMLPPGMMVPPQLRPQINQPPVNALQNLLSNSGVMSVESLEQQRNEMPPLPTQAKAAKELESDFKAKVNVKKTQQQQAEQHQKNKSKDNNKTTKAKANKTNGASNNGSGGISYASIVAAPTSTAAPPPTVVYKPVMEAKEPPQLLSPMVFGQIPPPKPAVEVAQVPNLPPPMMQQHLNNGSFVNQRPPLPEGGITPLNEDQLVQAFQHLLRTERGFVGKLHQAYVESLNTHLH